MSSVPTSPTVIPSSPSRHENLVGAILWLLPLEQIPDHGRYKLKAKACGHPCVVVQDRRATEPDLVRICVLASYSQSVSYNSLGRSEQHDHIPIHPNEPDSRVQPSILYLRRRQRTEMLLKKQSWVNTRRVYKVPVSILRPYETFQSWCRYRLADSSIQALQSALLISASDLPIGPSPAQLLSTVSSTNQPVPNDPLSSPDLFWNPVEITSGESPPQQANVTISEGPASEDSRTVPAEPEAQVPIAGAIDSRDNPSEVSDARTSAELRVPLSYKQCPFHLIFPFDSGPHSKRNPEYVDFTIDSPLLPPPVTANNTLPRCKSQRRIKSITYVCGAVAGIWFLVLCLFVSTKVFAFVSSSSLQSWISMAVDQVAQ